jgi:hypothetical protein
MADSRPTEIGVKEEGDLLALLKQRSDLKAARGVLLAAQAALTTVQNTWIAEREAREVANNVALKAVDTKHTAALTAARKAVADAQAAIDAIEAQ